MIILLRFDTPDIVPSGCPCIGPCERAPISRESSSTIGCIADCFRNSSAAVKTAGPAPIIRAVLFEITEHILVDHISRSASTSTTMLRRGTPAVSAWTSIPRSVAFSAFRDVAFNIMWNR